MERQLVNLTIGIGHRPNTSILPINGPCGSNRCIESHRAGAEMVGLFGSIMGGVQSLLLI